MPQADNMQMAQTPAGFGAWLKCLRAVLVRSANAWIDHRASSKGAALAFYTMFSTTPILVLAIAGAGYFFWRRGGTGRDHCADAKAWSAAAVLQRFRRCWRAPDIPLPV